MDEEVDLSHLDEKILELHLALESIPKSESPNKIDIIPISSKDTKDRFLHKLQQLRKLERYTIQDERYRYKGKTMPVITRMTELSLDNDKKADSKSRSQCNLQEPLVFNKPESSNGKPKTLGAKTPNSTNIRKISDERRSTLKVGSKKRNEGEYIKTTTVTNHINTSNSYRKVTNTTRNQKYPEQIERTPIKEPYKIKMTAYEKKLLQQQLNTIMGIQEKLDNNHNRDQRNYSNTDSHPENEIENCHMRYEITKRRTASVSNHIQRVTSADINSVMVVQPITSLRKLSKLDKMKKNSSMKKYRPKSGESKKSSRKKISKEQESCREAQSDMVTLHNTIKHSMQKCRPEIHKTTVDQRQLNAKIKINTFIKVVEPEISLVEPNAANNTYSSQYKQSINSEITWGNSNENYPNILPTTTTEQDKSRNVFSVWSNSTLSSEEQDGQTLLSKNSFSSTEKPKYYMSFVTQTQPSNMMVTSHR